MNPPSNEEREERLVKGSSKEDALQKLASQQSKLIETLRQDNHRLMQMVDVGSVSGLMKAVQKYQQRERDNVATSSDLDLLLVQTAAFLKLHLSSSVCLVCNHDLDA